MTPESTDKKYHSNKQRTSAAAISTELDKSKRKNLKKSQDFVNTSVESKAVVSAFAPPCTYCAKDHSLEACKVFINQRFTDRTQHLRTKGFCYGCLKSGHIKPNCRNKLSCKVCQFRHPTILHISDSNNSNRPTYNQRNTTHSSMSMPEHTGPLGAQTRNQTQIKPLGAQTRDRNQIEPLGAQTRDRTQIEYPDLVTPIH